MIFHFGFADFIHSGVNDLHDVVFVEGDSGIRQVFAYSFYEGRRHNYSGIQQNEEPGYPNSLFSGRFLTIINTPDNRSTQPQPHWLRYS